MTATTVRTFTLADLRECTAGILLDLAAAVRPDTYGCAECLHGLADMCDGHGERAAEASRLERAAATVAKAKTREEIALAVHVAETGGTR